MDPFGLQSTIDILVMPFIGVLVMLVVTLWIKDYAAKIAKGIAFNMNKSFREGDKVIIDGEQALIVKIGLIQTVFGVTKSEGDWDGDYVWRYVPNERIPFLKLEKVIFDHMPRHNARHIEDNKKNIEGLKGDV
jgi:hypothetical protein